MSQYLTVVNGTITVSPSGVCKVDTENLKEAFKLLSESPDLKLTVDPAVTCIEVLNRAHHKQRKPPT